jgi:transcriptional regulator with XRE-family HTH domain
MLMSEITPEPGDVGPRVAFHRERLGLTREELDDRTGIPPGSVEYIEDNPTRVTEGALSHLADALDTTRADLIAGNVDQPLRRDRPLSTELDREECMRLIASGGIGRIAFDGAPGPTVLPVDYVMHDGAIIFRTQVGGPIEQDLRTGLEDVDLTIGFEVDRIDEVRRRGWSVLVQGPVRHLTVEELSSVSDSGMKPWAGGDRETYIKITPKRVTGRRIQGA